MVKKASKNDADKVITSDDVENKRLQELAIDQGVLSKHRRIAVSTLPPSSLMLKADGKDITKRSSARRNRYLLVFNCQLAPAAAGRLGTLAKLDTKNPVMYIDFPEGRLRLRGTLIFPKNKYLVLRLGKEALCEDVLESMIVFSEAHWVGTEAENPNEDELPMPESLKTNTRHTNVDFGGRGNNSNAMQTGTNELDYEETQEEDMGDAAAAATAGGGVLSQEQGGSLPASQRRGSRRAVATGKRARYAEDSDASFGDDDEDGDGDSDREPAPRKLPRVSSGAAAVRRLPPAAGKTATKAAPKADKAEKPQSHAIINLTGDSSDDEDQPLAARGKQSTLANFVQKRTSIGKKATPQAKRAKKSSQKSASDDEEEVIDLASLSSEEEGEEEEEDAGDALPASQRPRRTAAGIASQKLQDTEDEEDEASDDEGGSGADEEEDSEGAAADESEEEYEEDGASDEESDGYAPSE